MNIDDKDDKDSDSDSGARRRGPCSSGAGKRGLIRQFSGALILDVSDGSERLCDHSVNVSRVNALRASVNRHSNLIARTLLTSKDTIDKTQLSSRLTVHVGTRLWRFRSFCWTYSRRGPCV